MIGVNGSMNRPIRGGKIYFAKFETNKVAGITTLLSVTILLLRFYHQIVVFLKKY